MNTTRLACKHDCCKDKLGQYDDDQRPNPLSAQQRWWSRVFTLRVWREEHLDTPPRLQARTTVEKASVEGMLNNNTPVAMMVAQTAQVVGPAGLVHTHLSCRVLEEHLLHVQAAKDKGVQETDLASRPSRSSPSSNPTDQLKTRA